MDSTTIGGAPVTTAHYARFAASLVAGFCAALCAGAAMALVMIVAFVAFEHTPLLYALRPIGSYLFGDRMLTAPTAPMYLAAAAFHFGVCALWGIVFAFAATLLRVDKSIGGALALGLVVGLASQIVDIQLVTPPLMQQLWGHNLWAETVPPLASWVGHLVFGAGLALAPLWFRPLWLRWSGRDDLLAGDPRLDQLS